MAREIPLACLFQLLRWRVMFALCLFQNGVWKKWGQTRQAVSIPAYILDDGAWKVRQPCERIFKTSLLVSTRRFSINRNFSSTTGNAIKELIINLARDLDLTMGDCRGRSHDGARNMAGRYVGV